MTKLQANINYVNFVFALIVLEILFGISTSLSIIRPGKPLIKSVRQLNESSIEIEWKVNNLQFNFNDVNLKRYRIFYRNDEDYDVNLFEWPGQIIKTNEELLKGAYYYTYNTTSTFDCYNQCIKNPTCDFAQSKNDKDDFFFNCLLYNRPRDDTNNNNKLNNAEFLRGNDGEIMKISDYTDKIVLQNVPANKKFIFQVGVYDEDLNSWSEISDEYEMFQMKIEIELSYEKNVDGSILLKWKQIGPFKNYIISRYNITVKSQTDSKAYQSYSKELSKYADYYELDKENLQQKASNENDCFQMCLKKSSCIRYVYFINDYRCYLLTNLNLTNGIYRNKQSSTYSIKSESSYFKLKNLKSFTDYAVQLHFKTPFGDSGTSNAIKFSTGEIQNQELDENEINETIENSNNIFETNDQINENHENKDEVTNKNNQTTSDEIDTIQIDSDEYYYIYEIDKSYDSYFDNEDTNNVKKNKIKKRKTTIKSTIANIFTTKKTSIEEKVTEKEKDEENLIQKPSEIKEDQQTSNQNSKEDENVDGINVPSMPKIVNATIQKEVLWIKWNVDDNGGSNIKNVILEWSPDFSNKSLQVGTKNLNWEQKKSDKTSQAFLKDTPVPPNNQIRMTVTNENGASEKSQIFLVKCLGECDTLNKEEIRGGGGLNSPNTKPETYMTKKTGMIILILTAILISFILIYVIYDCRRSMQKASEKEQTNEENGQDEKLIK